MMTPPNIYRNRKWRQHLCHQKMRSIFVIIISTCHPSYIQRIMESPTVKRAKQVEFNTEKGIIIV